VSDLSSGVLESQLKGVPMLSKHEKKLIIRFKMLKTKYPHFYLVTLLCVLLIVSIPVLIWLVYFIGRNGKGIPTGISAGDLLGFYGSLLAFAGTIALGALALWQNKKANDLNKTLTEQNLVNSYFTNIAPRRCYIQSKLDKINDSIQILGKRDEEVIPITIEFENMTNIMASSFRLRGCLILDQTVGRKIKFAADSTCDCWYEINNLSGITLIDELNHRNSQNGMIPFALGLRGVDNQAIEIISSSNNKEILIWLEYDNPFRIKASTICSMSVSKDSQTNINGKDVIVYKVDRFIFNDTVLKYNDYGPKGKVMYYDS
jgi:hypothetical protein